METATYAAFFPMNFGMLPIHIPLRTKEAAEQCPALRVAVTLAERRNPSCEVLKRCSARLVTVRDDNLMFPQLVVKHGGNWSYSIFCHPFPLLC